MSERYDVVCDSSDRTTWLAARKSGIGASEISSVLGMDRYCSELELFLRKTGQVQDDDEASEAAEWGQILEPIIAQGFHRRTARTVTMAGKLLRSREFPWALATLDAWQSIGGGCLRPLEIKLTGGRAPDWAAGVPEYYRPQIQQQLLVTGEPWSSVAALLNGTRLVYMDVERDDEMIARIIEEGERFWRCVTDESAPPPDGSKSAGWALKQLYAQSADDTVALDWECAEQTDRYDVLSAELDALELEKERIRQAVMVRLGPASVGVLPGENGMWTWKSQRRKTGEIRILKRVKARKS